jgi:ATP-dependent helicase/nuclease subunit B
MKPRSNCRTALPPLQRRLLLAQLVMKWAAQLKPAAGEPALIVHSPARALALADDLARLIDDMTTRQVPWARSTGWCRTISTSTGSSRSISSRSRARHWPRSGRRAQDRAGGAARPPDRGRSARGCGAPGPVIAAGSTGSMPATAKLLATIATLPHGAVVLPGLDTELDEAAWS